MPSTPGTINYPTTLDDVVSLVEVANAAQTQLNGLLAAGATTITVDSTTLFPSSGILWIENESIAYTGKTGTTFTGAVRGFEGTSNVQHLDNTLVEGNISAKHHQVLAAGLIASETEIGVLAKGIHASVAARLSFLEFSQINAQTGTTYTLVLADANKLVTMSNGAANTLTIPTNASVAFSTGTIVEIWQIGAGQTTVAAAGGVTLNSRGSVFKLAGQWATAFARKYATDSWVLGGDLTA